MSNRSGRGSPFLGQVQLVYLLLHAAMKAIREIGWERGNGLLFHLGALLEPVPLQLERSAASKNTYADALGDLKERARASGMEGWLNHAVADHEGHKRFLKAQGRQDLEPQDEMARIHYLLYLALLEVRAEAHEVGDRRAWGIADAFDGVPLQMLQVLRRGASVTEVLDRIRERARVGGCGEWFDDVLRDATRESGGAEATSG